VVSSNYEPVLRDFIVNHAAELDIHIGHHNTKPIGLITDLPDLDDCSSVSSLSRPSSPTDIVDLTEAIKEVPSQYLTLLGTDTIVAEGNGTDNIELDMIEECEYGNRSFY